jgi:hypothetical protein
MKSGLEDEDEDNAGNVPREGTHELGAKMIYMYIEGKHLDTRVGGGVKPLACWGGKAMSGPMPHTQFCQAWEKPDQQEILLLEREEGNDENFEKPSGG